MLLGPRWPDLHLPPGQLGPRDTEQKSVTRRQFGMWRGPTKREPTEDQATPEAPKEVTVGQSAPDKNDEGWQVAWAMG